MQRIVTAMFTAAVLALSLPAAAQEGQSRNQPAGTASSPAGARTMPSSFNELATSKLPAVVSIATTQRMEGGPGGIGPIPGLPEQLPPGLREFFNSPGFREFFGRPDQMPSPGPSQALGSGFVVDSSGYIVTNNHVVEDGDEITVVLQDESELAATLVGRDPRSDLALLKVETDRELPALEWGDSDTALVGDWVLAIGNPFGLGGSVTAGIISARARDIQVGPYDDFIQTDASINRGNSGGPLFNMDGQVIGVNTAIFSPTGGNIGIGFAIPSNVARNVVEELREHGEVRRGWLGVQIQPVTPEVAEALGLDGAKGALVSAVTEGSPAAEAGIEVGDVILSFAGQSVEELRDLPRAVAQAPIGQEAAIEIFREGERLTLNPKIALLEDEAEAVAQGEEPAPESTTGPLGLALADLTPELRAQFGIDEATEGVLVAEVAMGSVAAEQGMRPGDVIIRVGRQGVSTPQQVVEAVEQARQQNRDTVLILRKREENQAYVALPLDPPGTGQRG